MRDLTCSEHSRHVLTGRDGDVGYLVLDRPKAINALDTAMCRALHAGLDEFNAATSLQRIEIRSTSERGLCAGGDVRSVRQHVVDGDRDAAMEFFTTEYAMNLALDHSRVPVQAHQRGIVMGGGLGISAHAQDRVVYADAQIAMPETIIGFHPDVGMMWCLAQAPGEWGVYLALTGSTINATDALAVGFSDRLADGDAAPESTLPDRSWVDECFAGREAGVIIERLENSDEAAAREAAVAIRQRSPLSVCIALEGIRRAQRMSSLKEVLDLDRTLARAALRNPDFVEGVRAQLVDKDRQPRWRHARVEDVKAGDVVQMFGEA